MKNNFLKTAILAISLTVASQATGFENVDFNIDLNTNSYQEKNWSEVSENIKTKMINLKKNHSKNLVKRMNERVKKIERQKRTTFTITAPKVMDVFVRDSYLVLEDKFVIKNAPVWKRVLIKEKDIWEY
jgi:hypothetical protein